MITGEICRVMIKQCVLYIVVTHRGLTVGFILLRFSVVCSVKSVSLVYLLFISRVVRGSFFMFV